MQIFIEQLPLSRQLKIPSRNYKNLLLIQGKFYSFIQTNLISATSTTPLHPPPPYTHAHATQSHTIVFADETFMQNKNVLINDLEIGFE